MKLIVTGATGFVGTEVIRQALRNPAVTSVVALTRKPIQPSNTGTTKLQSVVLEDWTSPYPEASKTPPALADYLLMRGRVENVILDFAKNTPDIQVTVTKPGGIDSPNRPIRATASPAMQAIYVKFADTPIMHVSELAAAMIDQCLNGITKDPLWAKDIMDIGKRVLGEEDYLR
ncbi:hypothetical protein G7Y89_g11659 [Cudoniella acicularis]|uniref:NAD(P)-binding domain-containing protein n=1 Tax=Cudoniella acicularis TaxID=354080 RepID=A0A8H4RCU7_9HELO|nr:hypothetical protein G7Y89_g11659 [Cudoniella acicularis]